jgi:hypothetical protein
MEKSFLVPSKKKRMLSIVPLICPQRTFVDRRQAPNAFCDMNPSLYVHENGMMTVLVRQVNYRKFVNRSFVVGQDASVSKYTLLRGKDCNDMKAEDIVFDYGQFPRFDVCWKGMEDVRFVTDKKLLVTVPECNVFRNPCIFLAELDQNVIRLTTALQPSIQEKNWMPFLHNQEMLVVYSVQPLVIKSLVADDRKQINLDPEFADALKNYHGSTNGVPFEEGLLFLVHKDDGSKTEHRWMFLQCKPEFRITKLSRPFSFLQYSYIEFPCSLAWKQKELAVALGVNDDKAFLITYSPNSIPWENSLKS